jgi:ribosomal protein S1
MKQLLSVIALVLAISAGALAHNGNDHVRGTVTQVSAQSVTVQLADKTSKTLTISAKTEFEAAGKPGHLADVKVGDRVVIDVPEHGSSALLIKVGAGPAKK